MTNTELLDLARRLWRNEIRRDGSECQALTPAEARTVWAFLSYEADRSHRSRACDKKARALFRSWLTPAQRRELDVHGRVRITGTAGGRYDISPYWVARGTRKLERHGKNWYAVSSYCWHDAAGELPKADVCLAHLLCLTTDELGFLAVANEHPITLQLWDGAYRRRLNAARRERGDEITQEITAARARVAAGLGVAA
jgi:hypothetical protein